MSNRLTYDFVKKSFESEGYTLLSDKYVNNTTKLAYVCPVGHKYAISWANWRKGFRCAVCGGKFTPLYDYVYDSFKSEGYELLSTEYENAHKKLEYICSNGHKHSIAWYSWCNGHRCPSCKGNARLSYGIVKNAFEKEGYILLSVEYKNAHQKLYYICSNGHKGSITWNSWKNGRRCYYCGGTVRHNYIFVSKNIKNFGYTCISDDYRNSRGILHLVCPNGHDYYVNWSNFYHKGNRCPICNNVGTSNQELELSDFIKSIYDKEILCRNRSIISPYELDLVIPDKLIAIEYCGLYWHSELCGKFKNYHVDKTLMCDKNNHMLITIFEDEWLKKQDIVKSVLKNKLGIFNGKKIYARKCDVKEISVKQAREFCEQNHLQGYTGSSVKLGLFYDEDLVLVMTFSKQSIAKGSKHKDNYWELSRFCNKIDHSVVGGASKLLKYFERNYFWEKIISYADRRWSNGDMYEKLGFTFEKFTQPNYWYFKNSSIDRIHRFVLRKKPEEPKDRTEWELRQEQGYNRIWDCGNYRFVKYNDCGGGNYR